MGTYHAPRGRPRTFRSGAHLFECMQAFCDDIIEKGYTVLPSKTEFCRWYSNQFEIPLSRRAVWAAVNQQYRDAKDDITALISDVLAQGAALGHWNSSITIFVLKNWCNWSDKQSDREGAGGGGQAQGKEITFTFEVVDKVEAKDEQA